MIPSSLRAFWYLRSPSFIDLTDILIFIYIYQLPLFLRSPDHSDLLISQISWNFIQWILDISWISTIWRSLIKICYQIKNFIFWFCNILNLFSIHSMHICKYSMHSMHILCIIIMIHFLGYHRYNGWRWKWTDLKGWICK